MKCIYCESTFKLTKYTKNSNICPECDGTVDNLSIPDEEVSVEAMLLINPSGRTRPVYNEEEESF